MTEHRHLIARPHPPYLCECGATYEAEKDRWVEPRTVEAKRMREEWEQR